jgi:hypothetical protein
MPYFPIDPVSSSILFVFVELFNTLKKKTHPKLFPITSLSSSQSPSYPPQALTIPTSLLAASSPPSSHPKVRHHPQTLPLFLLHFKT